MTSPIEDIDGLQVPAFSGRRLSLVNNDDFVFQASKRKKIEDIVDIAGVPIPASNRRRLSLVNHDDFVFQSSKRKEINCDDRSHCQPNQSHVSNSIREEELSDTITHLSPQNVSFSANDSNKEDYQPIWKHTDNPSIMRYRWMRTLRKKIMNDLTRHFGREVMHDRLFSCLCKLHDV